MTEIEREGRAWEVCELVLDDEIAGYMALSYESADRLSGPRIRRHREEVMLITWRADVLADADRQLEYAETVSPEIERQLATGNFVIEGVSYRLRPIDDIEAAGEVFDLRFA